MLAYFNDDDSNKSTRTILLDLVGGADTYALYLLDEAHDAELVGRVTVGEVLELRPNTVCLLRSEN